MSVRYPTDAEILEAANKVGEESFDAIRRIVYLTRAAEADGFHHGGEEWSSNMNDDEVQSDSPIYNYVNRLKAKVLEYDNKEREQL